MTSINTTALNMTCKNEEKLILFDFYRIIKLSENEMTHKENFEFYMEC